MLSVATTSIPWRFCRDPGFAFNTATSLAFILVFYAATNLRTTLFLRDTILSYSKRTFSAKHRICPVKGDFS